MARSTPPRLTDTPAPPDGSPVHLPETVIAELRGRLGVKVPAVVRAWSEKAGRQWAIRLPGGKWYRVAKSSGEPEETYRVEEGNPPRHYETTRLATLGVVRDSDAERTVLRGLYGEVMSAWRTLTDVRFKLIGLVPAVSVIAWSQLLGAAALGSPPGSYLAVLICVAGAVITAALRLYDLRNDQLYDDLISRGRKIEEELGIETGIFRGRPRAGSAVVNHTFPIRAIYVTTFTGWLALGVWFALT